MPQPARPFPPVARPGAPTAPAGKSKLSGLLATPKGQAGAAVALVAVYALYRRYKAGAADTSGTSTASGAAVPTADTSQTDLYSQLEPLIEQLSGFSGSQALAAGQQAQTQALLDAINAGKGTTTPPPITQGPNPPQKAALFPTETRAVGKVGLSVNLRNYVAQIYPKATKAQQDQIVFNTVNDPKNAKYHLGTGTIPGGALVEFLSAPVK